MVAPLNRLLDLEEVDLYFGDDDRKPAYSSRIRQYFEPDFQVGMLCSQAETFLLENGVTPDPQALGYTVNGRFWRQEQDGNGHLYLEPDYQGDIL